MEEMRRTLLEQQALINELLARENRRDEEAERQLQRRNAEEEQTEEEEEEEDEQEDEQAEESEESDRSRSPPRQQRVGKTTQYWVNQFCKLKPPAFQGKLDQAEDWLKKIEKIFRALECPHNLKAQLAIFQLEGDADRWWEVTASTLQAQYCHVTWERFLEKFNEQYFPSSVRMNKEAEFLHIRQGKEESFDDYYARFTNLSRYSSHLRQGNDETSMVNLMVHGLRYEIGERLMSHQFQELIHAVEACRLVERKLKDFQKSGFLKSGSASRNEDSRGDSSRKREAPWSKSQGEDKRPNQTGQQNKPGVTGPRQCPDCGKYHPGECWSKRVCYRCQKPGHIAPNCPERAAGVKPQNPGRIFAITSGEAGESSRMDRDTTTG